MLRWAALPMAVALTACPHPSPTIAPPPVAPAVAPELIVAGDVDVIAVDRDAVYWAAGGEVWRRGRAEAPRLLATATAPILALAAVDGTVYAASAERLEAVASAGGALRPVAPLPAWRALLVDRRAAWVGTDDAVVRIELDSGRARPLARVAAPVTALATAGDRVVIATASGELRSIADGGAAVALATDLPAPVALATLGSRVYWTAGDRGLRSVDVGGGGAARLELRGRARAVVAADDRLLLVTGAALAEWRRGRALVAPALEAGELAADSPVLASGDEAIVRLRGPDGAAGLWRVPRPSRATRPAAVVATFDDAVHGLAIDDGVALVALGPPDGRGHTVRAIAVATGRARTVTTVGWTGAVAGAVGRAAIADLAAASIEVVERDGARRAVTATPRVDALTVTARELWWGDGWRLWRQRDGAPPTIAHEPIATATVEDRFAPAALVVAGAHVYYSSLGRPGDGIYRAGPGQHRVALFERADARPLAGLVRVGDELFTTVGAADLVAVRLTDARARALPGPTAATVLHLFGGPRLSALTLTTGGVSLDTIDRARGAHRASWRVPGELTGPAPVADSAAVYGLLDDTGWLLAIPR